MNAAPALRSAAERISSDSRLEAALQDSQPRYFIQFGWDVFHVDTDAIPDRYILRGEVTPCANYRKKMHIRTIPDGALISGSEEFDKDGNSVYGYMLQLAGPDAVRLSENESGADYKQTLYELTALTGLSIEAYRRIDFNSLLYPDGIENLPEKHADVISYLKTRTAEIRKNGLPEGIPPFVVERIMTALDQIVRAADYALKVQTARLEETHLRFKVPPSDPSGRFKKNYDSVDEEMLRRTGLPRHSEAEVTTARALEMLAGEKVSGSNNDELKALIALQAQQMEMMRQQLELMREQMPPRERQPEEPKPLQPATQPKK